MNQIASVPRTAVERGKIAPVKFAHVVLRTSRYEELVNWYKTVLEAEAMATGPMLTFLTYDDEHHRIAIVGIADLGEPQPGTAGLEHFAFTYASADDLFTTFERLRDAAIEPYWCINHGPTLSFYYRDPDRNQVELQIDLFEDVQGVNEWMAQSDFDTNPIGVKFDPVDLIRRYRAGENTNELFARPRIDPTEVASQFPTR